MKIHIKLDVENHSKAKEFLDDMKLNLSEVDEIRLLQGNNYGYLHYEKDGSTES